jgi:catechol 2,3-dioxygenase-like lactoylglutathione lyase family enzyme
MVSSFNHTGLVVDDLEAMVRFYCDDLGLKELRRIESVAPPEGNHTGIPGSRRTLVFVGFEDGHRIELVKYHEPASPNGHLEIPQLGASHICFNVGDLQQTYEALSTKGIRFVTEPKFTERHGRRSGIVYAQDPEGNWLEFIQ